MGDEEDTQRKERERERRKGTEFTPGPRHSETRNVGFGEKSSKAGKKDNRPTLSME